MAENEARVSDDAEVRFFQNGGDSMKAPCYGCEERAFRCHSTCERYGRFHANRDAIINARAAENSMGEYVSLSRERNIRKNYRSRR